MTRTEAERLAERIADDVQRGWAPVVMLGDCDDSRSPEDPGFIPHLDLWRASDQVYLGRLHGEGEYEVLFAAAWLLAAGMSLT